MKSISSISRTVLSLSVLLIASLAAPAVAGTAIIGDWQFNTTGDCENWISRSSWYIPGGLFVDSAVDDTASVLSAVDLGGNGDVGILYASCQLPVLLPENCSNWESFTVRLRHLDANAPDGNPIAFGGGAKLWLDGIGLASDLPSSSSGIWTVEYQADNWVVFTVDLSGLTGNANDITSMRLDPISSTEGNFEIDYMQLTARSVNYASTYYLDAVNGDDITGDGTQAAPFKTVDAVWDLLRPGNTVVLADGNYANIEIYTDGWHTEPQNIFSDYITFVAAEGANPVFDHIWMGTHTASSNDYSDGFHGTYDVFLRFDGIEIADGIILQHARNVEFFDCLITREGPYTGSESNIEKIAAQLNSVTGVTFDGCEITDTGVGVFASGHDVAITNCNIHGGSHDGIRPWGLRDSLIANNQIHDFDDGVSDDEGYDWNRHCDLIHFSIRGPGYDGWGCDNVVVRGNNFADAQGQALIINGYISTPTRHSNITIENNIFTPVGSTMVNLVEKTDGVIFRNNTVIDLGHTIAYNGYNMGNTAVRFGGDLTGVQIYNNILKAAGIDDGCGVDFFDYNIIANTSNSPSGVDESRCYGRFTLLDQYPGFADIESLDGELAYDSVAINAGTLLMAPTTMPDTDIVGTARDNRPDLGAWEYPGLSPAAEQLPGEYNDTKTCFVDDFEDGHYNDVDPYLAAPNTQGLSWMRPAGFGYRYAVKYTNRLDRNSIAMPNGITTGRQAWLLSQQGSDWASYSFAFDCNNAYLSYGGGVCVLVSDVDNCYYIDIASGSGRLIRILDGQQSVLAESSAIEMPNTGERAYLVDVDVADTGITISVDADNNASVDLSYVDDDPAAIAALSSGGVGLHCDNMDRWHVLYFDNIEVNVSAFDSSSDALPGDANADGVVDLDDFIILKQNYGSTGATSDQGDFNGDGTVDLDDFIILKQNYGSAI